MDFIRKKLDERRLKAWKGMRLEFDERQAVREIERQEREAAKEAIGFAVKAMIGEDVLYLGDANKMFGRQFADQRIFSEGTSILTLPATPILPLIADLADDAPVVLTTVDYFVKQVDGYGSTSSIAVVDWFTNAMVEALMAGGETINWTRQPTMNYNGAGYRVSSRFVITPSDRQIRENEYAARSD